MIVNLLLIGNGDWGKKYISTLNTFKNVNFTISNRNNWKQLIDDKPDGVLICTPPLSHIEIARYSLERCVPTMIEKPLALSLKEAKALKQYTTPILVNHSHIFSKWYQDIKKEIDINDIEYISTRGEGPVIRDYSSLFDYGSHDLSMILDLLNDMPQSVVAIEQEKNSFTIDLEFKKCKSHSIIGYNINKVRSFILHKKDKVKHIYVNDPNSLNNAIKVFIGAIEGKRDYRLGLDLSLKVVQVLEGCQNSLNRRKI